MRVGIVVATQKESDPFLEAMLKIVGGAIQYRSGPFMVHEWVMAPLVEGLTIFWTKSKVAEIDAAMTTQHLIDRYNVDKIINYGVVGGLTDDTPAHTVGYVRKVIHYGLDFGPGYKKFQYPGQDGIYIVPKEDALDVENLGIREFVCSSSDKVILREEKPRLRGETGADICEMEAAGILLTCNRNGIPVSFIKSVSDGLDEDEEAFQANVKKASKACVDVILKALHIPNMLV